jgi:DNA-binding NtrC family response regulator
MSDALPDWIGARLLVVDDDPMVVRSMRRALQRVGYEVDTALGVEEAISQALLKPPDVALIDLALPDGSGLDVLRSLKERDPTVECIIFTGHSSAPVAVQAYEAGAVEYFEKPITDWQRFEHVLKRALRLRKLARSRQEPSAPPAWQLDPLPAEAALRRELVGNSKAMDDIRRHVRQLAPRSTTVLLVGPSGAGKTTVAEALHRAGGRRGALEVVSCSALHGASMYAELFGEESDGGVRGVRRSGAFERAADGTIVLDEIADLPMELQGNLLQALDGRSFVPRGGSEPVPVRARVIATTHRDLEQMAEEGSFRADLLNRLGIRVKIPGIEERREDVPQLVYLFLRQVNAREGLEIRRVSDEVLHLLMSHDWSRSNVRGLRTAVEQAAIFSMSDALALDALPAELKARHHEVPAPSEPVSALPAAYRDLSYQEFKEQLLNDFMGLYLRDLLEQTAGNVTHAAKIADLHRPNFRRLMKRYGIEPQG